MWKPKPKPAGVRRPAPSVRPSVEALEARDVPALFSFTTGTANNLMAMASRPASTGNAEIEAADDFVLSSLTVIDQATFTGLLPTNTSLTGISKVRLEIYRVFPNDSDVTRTSGAPNFTTTQVPTRSNSPSDNAFATRGDTPGDLTFSINVLNPTFTATNSVLNGIKVNTGAGAGGDGSVSGEEVKFTVSLNNPVELPAGHYFFVPQVQLANGQFFWLSAPKPANPPLFTGDLQAWIRNDALAPDWLRVGTDIVGGSPAPQFNGAFSLAGELALTPKITSLSPPNGNEFLSTFTLTVNGSNFTKLSTIRYNGTTLPTTFLSDTQLQAVVPSSIISLGNAAVTVFTPGVGSSNTFVFSVADRPSSLRLVSNVSRDGRDITIAGFFSDTVVKAHHIVVNWGNGDSYVIDLDPSSGSPFIVSYRFPKGNRGNGKVLVAISDDRGVLSNVVILTVPHGHGPSHRHASARHHHG
jgi:hypothetical protein